MNVERIRGGDLASAMRQVRLTLGGEAMILMSRTTLNGDLEVLATSQEEVDALRRQLDGRAPDATRGRAPGIRPHLVALVGPPGAGKTTALMKLALSPRGYGGRRVGVMTLDTYRVGALGEIRAYADVMGFPLEVLYSREESEGALRRLRDCEVILVDTPGRLGLEEGRLPEWISILRALPCDEVHLVLPAGSRVPLVRYYRWRCHPCGPTHFLLARMDECMRDAGVLEVARATNLPARWVAAGTGVPDGLSPALPGILNTVAGTRWFGSPGPLPERPIDAHHLGAVG